MPLSELTIDGIKKFGNGWRARVVLNIPKDIPSLFAPLTTNFDAILLGHNIASDVVRRLRKQRNFLPKESLDEIDAIIEQFESSNIYEDIESVKNWSTEDLEEFGCHAQEEILGQLNELYDWAGYYRILIVNN